MYVDHAIEQIWHHRDVTIVLTFFIYIATQAHSHASTPISQINSHGEISLIHPGKSSWSFSHASGADRFNVYVSIKTKKSCSPLVSWILFADNVCCEMCFKGNALTKHDAIELLFQNDSCSWSEWHRYLFKGFFDGRYEPEGTHKRLVVSVASFTVCGVVFSYLFLRVLLRCDCVLPP